MSPVSGVNPRFEVTVLARCWASFADDPPSGQVIISVRLPLALF